MCFLVIGDNTIIKRHVEIVCDDNSNVVLFFCLMVDIPIWGSSMLLAAMVDIYSIV